ncbi:MAG: hypothetical protein KDD92_01020 [Caldilineaceae bacterium]|nr:hypothetical protein [Caldilineaceae bacterium]
MARIQDFLLDEYTSDDLKSLLDLTGTKKKPTRKAERAALLEEILTDPAEVKRLWGEMDEVSQLALAFAYHSDGLFTANAFSAQYNMLPQRPKKRSYSWYGEPMLLDLFMPGSLRGYIGNRSIYPDVMPLLAPLMPPPDRFELRGIENPPPHSSLQGFTYAVEILPTEKAGRQDLLLVLSLVEQGGLRFAQKKDPTLTPKGAEMLEAAITPLADGATGAFLSRLRAYGLVIFAVESGLVSGSGKNFCLTELGKQYLVTEDPALLLDAFTVWSEEASFDELTRIAAIRGTRSKGLKLTPPAERRSRIVEALSWAPVGVWISIHEFYRALRAWQLDFEIEEGGLEKLYVGYQYRSGGYYEPWADGGDMWLLTNGLYINAIFFEYLAAIGAIDLVFVEDVDYFPAATYNGDDVKPYSDYDGLSGFRITPLGAYLFGQAKSYTPPKSATEALFSLNDAGGVTLLNPAALSSAQSAQLEQIADGSGATYRLSKEKLLTILEEQKDLDMQRLFLSQRNQGPLPAGVEALLATAERDSKAFRLKTPMVTISVRSEELAQLVMEDPVAGKIARQLDSRTLLIPANRETAFRNALRDLGYGLG